jgi:hypothetical protein
MERPQGVPWQQCGAPARQTCNKKIQRARERIGGVRIERKMCLIEDNMTENYDPSSGEVETPVTLMEGGVSEKDTSSGAWSQLVFRGGCEVGIAEANKNTKNGVVRGLLVELLIRNSMANN